NYWGPSWLSVIDWTQQYGTHAVQGYFANYFLNHGGEQGPFGCAIGDETNGSGPGDRMQVFQNGEIQWQQSAWIFLSVYKLNSNTIRFSWDLGDSVSFDGFLVLFGLNGNAAGETQFDHDAGGTSGYVDLGPNTSPIPWGPTNYTFVPGSTYTFSI